MRMNTGRHEELTNIDPLTEEKGLSTDRRRAGGLRLTPSPATAGKRPKIQKSAIGPRASKGIRSIAYLTEESVVNYLDLWFITGLADSRGLFFFLKSEVKFQIKLHSLDLPLLKSVKASLKGIGFIKNNKGVAEFTVSSLTELTYIIDHFDRYPLITRSKSADYLLFKRAVQLKMKIKEHFSKKGLQSSAPLVNIKASLNLGLSEDLKVTFPETKPVARPVLSDQKVSNPEWIAGFTSGDGSFSVSIYNDPSRKLGVRISVRFVITGHIRDKSGRQGGFTGYAGQSLMKSFVEYFNCGSYRLRATTELGEYVVFNLSDIIEKIVPFFQKYKVRGIKLLDFQD